MLQTSDPFRYFNLFLETSLVNRHFCSLRDVRYTAYIGLKVGSSPWHATYNRIILLSELMGSGFRGWAVYLDADAYIADLHFDIQSFLSSFDHRSILGAPGGDQLWNLNAGILFLNLAQPTCRRILSKWSYTLFTEVGQEKLDLAKQPWDPQVKDDQVLLHQVLAQEDTSAVEKLPLTLVGAPQSRFVRQLLRQYGSLEERCARARLDVANVIRQPEVTCSPSER